MEIVFAALLLGLGGSFHCVGMCGPIALALPLHGRSVWGKVFGAFIYNFGRSVTYGLMGLLFGLIGEGLQMAGLQKWVSIIMGSIMVLTVVFPSMGHKVNTRGIFVSMNKLKSSLQRLFSKTSNKSLFVLGFLNGLLPCGLVYMAIAGALATAGLLSSVMFMVLFGLGTIPMMMAVSLAGNLASQKIRHIINKVIPYMIVIVGLLFILRGLGLGIKFISPADEKLKIHKKEMTQPQMQMSPGMKHDCCTKGKN